MTEADAHAPLIAGRYQLGELLGRGGAGAVWRGEDHHLHRAVAIKQIVRSEHRTTRSRVRAVREAQAIAKLRTPGVVQIYDVFDDGPYVYLVMELVNAPSLARLVRRDGPFEPQRAAIAGRSMVTTLGAIHRAGIVHRDVKPSNVLVDGDGLRLTDFGIALLGDDPSLTAAGSVLGTPAYMAPEQARGERAGPAADLYGLGATLYYAVEGCAPFADSGSLETAQAVRDQPHRPACQLGPLEPIISALLSKDPHARPGLAEIDAELADAARGTALPKLPAPDEPLRVDAAEPNTAPPRAGTQSDDEGRQLRRVLLWVVLLLTGLTVALWLLFVAVREQPAQAAGVIIGLTGLTTYHGGADMPQAEERTQWNR